MMPRATVDRSRRAWEAARDSRVGRRREDAVSTGDSAQKSVRLSGAGLAAALVVLLAFGVFVVFMLTQIGGSELRWTRAAWLFASVEAIAFGAAGALFGSSIQRERAEKAEADARENAKDAANGRALASVVLADAPDGDGGDLETLGPERERPSAPRSHVAVARDLFPDLAARSE